MKLLSPSGSRPRPDALVAFCRSGKEGAPDLGTLPKPLAEEAARHAPAKIGFDGTSCTIPLGEGGPARRLYLFGAGKSGGISPRKARGLLRTALGTAAKNGETSVEVDFPFRLERMNAAECRDFLLRSLALADYDFRTYKTVDNDPSPVKSAWFSAGRGPWKGVRPATAAQEVAAAETVVAAAELVRELGNTPPCDMTPRLFASRMEAEAKKRQLGITVLDRKAIEKERMGGLLAVSRGSQEEPRLVVLEHRGGKAGEPPVALVGKGVTFDAGGISIKPAEKMGEMKWDMMGAATAVGTLLAAADLKLPVNLVAIAPLTENLPSGSAYKPGDIVRFRSGKTAEIDNTDAEGRVILADALDYAKNWKPQAILDYATLTGAALVALGLEAAIVFTADDRLARALVSAGERTDERLWRLPLWEDYKENIKSDWADFKNTGGRWGGSINGAMFLKEFVDPATPWAHLDIAATANYEKEFAGYAPGATAFGLSLTLRWLRDRLGRRRPARKRA
ncbi:MAG: leucyl aminopeptidase family protein [Acidithiobacillales bacterium]